MLQSQESVSLSTLYASRLSLDASNEAGDIILLLVSFKDLGVRGVEQRLKLGKSIFCFSPREQLSKLSSSASPS